VDCAHGGAQPTGTDRTEFTFRADNTIQSETVGAGTAFQYPDSHVSGATSGDRCKTYTYDGFDRLIAADAKSATDCPAQSVTYTYDGLDRQVSRTVGSTTTALHYVGLGTGNDRSVTGSATTDTALTATGRPLAVKDATKTHYLALDGTGSVGTVVDSAAAVKCQTAYDTFGALLNAGGTTAASGCSASVTPNTRWFNAESRDDTTGNYQLGSRTYDPAKGAFLTPDSFRAAAPEADASLGSDPLTANRYSYVNGDPVNYDDPDGHEPHPLGGGRGWTGFGCSAGDCTPEAAEARDTYRRERSRMEQQAEEARLKASPTPAAPAPGPSPTAPPMEYTFKGIKGCNDECRRELIDALAECPADMVRYCYDFLRDYATEVYGPMTLEDREPLMEVDARVAYGKHGTPTPKTDNLAHALAKMFGDPVKCGASERYGLPVYCVHGASSLPLNLFPVPPRAEAVTYGHYIFCREDCGSLLSHEMVHVGQWERYGDHFAKLYIAELIATDGDSQCGNRWEVPAYEKNAPGLC
jgi:RHS repeat-associated protein